MSDVKYGSKYANGAAVDLALDEGVVAYTQANSHAEFPNGNLLTPVNQRTRVSGAAYSTTGTYFLDQLKLISGSMIWTSGTGVALNGVAKVYFENLPAWLYEKSFPVTIGIGSTEYHATLTWPTSNTGAAATVTVNGVTITIGYESYSATLCGVASSYVPYITLTTSVSTVINYIYSKTPPSDFREQLSLCQRYFVRNTSAGSVNIANGNAALTTAINFIVIIPKTMRISPSVAVGSLSNIVCRNGQTDLAISGLVPNVMVPGAVYMTATVTGAVQGAMYQLRITNSDHIDFSSEM